MNRGRLCVVASVATALLYGVKVVSAAPQPLDENDRVHRQLQPEEIEVLMLSDPVSSATIDPGLRGATGERKISVVLKSSPAAMMANEMSQPELMSYKAKVESEQQAFMSRTRMTENEITCVQTLLNAVFLSVDVSDVAELAADPDVVSISLVGTYEMFLSETVPYIGAKQVQDLGYDGNGVKVAILDSGIDYTHASLGGQGTIEAYEEAYKDPTSRDGLFPTDKVVGGYDFVGEDWPFGDVLPDDDPIDFDGHGTAVADIVNAVAPGVSLYAVKVCSAVESSCDGMAIIQGLEYAVDPNGDGDISDAVDIINLSLGSNYQQPYDDLISQSANAASALGVLIVASAGNGGDKPFITGSPASAQSVLSVAQTQVPSAYLQIIAVAGGERIPAVIQPWSKELENIITGSIQYGDGSGGNLDGCAPFAEGSLAGKIVLVDRGVCNFTLKINQIFLGGGLAGIIGLVAPGAPFPGGDGGDRPVDVPGYMISQGDADVLRASVGQDAVLDPDDVLSLVMSMAGSSSRGPLNQDIKPRGMAIKPEIGAPGASVAAVVGSGTGTTPFGGTSGAAPMVAGSAALLLEAYPLLTPPEIKARLMNNGETNIDTDPFEGLTPISRIGGGEVRVDKALSARAAAWDDETLLGALSFGFVDVYEKTQRIFKKIRIRNYSNDAITYQISPTFRYDVDELSGAVSVPTVFPGKVLVAAKQDRVVSVVMTIRGDLLPGNFMNSGAEGANGTALTANEFDGYFILDDGVQPIHIPWHVLPRKAANVEVATNQLDFNDGVATVDVSNTGVGTAQLDAFSLLAVGPDLPEGGPGEEKPNIDIRAVGVKTTEVPPNVCSGSPSFVMSFAISTWERQQHLFPVILQVLFDIDRDGVADYALLTSDESGPGSSATELGGRQFVFALDLFNMSSGALFFAEHSMNTGNTVLNVCAEQLGLSESDLQSTNIDITIESYSTFYSTKEVPDDTIDRITLTPGGERYVATVEDLAPGESGIVKVTDRDLTEGNTNELGVMLIANGDRGPGNRGGATQETELTLLYV
eukprot:CAMPEP_0202491660 /NCGR_PEP_ID=MMETSP1361-20130828/8644_1 /ASSEMBLY_ACC=CAM_ASM_000849 /TAXON_ID=210615 /ORGANISM="Staurosira complex sp., Strain CCMP2646" /LENGTH=1038 /DNA_ID=CAMNT_0049121747 /DNA_START=142 /DNA_END=3258 /DNA_ORIENTATION=+